MADHILAIDLGTSGPKVALFSTHGGLIGSETETTRLILTPDGGAEQDPDDWWSAIDRAVRRLLARDLAPASSIVAIAVTAQWAGTVAVDRAGRALRNAITWLDQRGAPHIQRVVSGPLRFQGYGVDKLWHWLRLTGGIPTLSGKDPIAHILYLRYAEPHIHQQTYKYLEPKDYLNLRLTGLFATSADTATLHWVTDNRNIHAIDYHPRLLKLADIERDKLPDLLPTASVLGPILPDVAAEWGLGSHVQVVIGAPDILSAAVGSGAVRDGELHLYIGTSAWLSAHVPAKKTDLLHNMAALPSAIAGRYLLINEQDVAGGCLNFLRDNLFYADDELQSQAAPHDFFGRLDRVVAVTAPGSDGVIFTPWLNGERSPVEDHRVRGGFHNLSLRHTRSHLVRAVFEGVALNARWLLGHAEAFVGRRSDGIRIVGGGARSDIWCQILADVFDRPIQQVEEPLHANTRGAAIMAAVALGELRIEDVPAQVPITRTFTPDPLHRQTYDRLAVEFVNIYKQNKAIHARLNR